MTDDEYDNTFHDFLPLHIQKKVKDGDLSNLNPHEHVLYHEAKDRILRYKRQRRIWNNTDNDTRTIAVVGTGGVSVNDHYIGTIEEVEYGSLKQILLHTAQLHLHPGTAEDLIPQEVSIAPNMLGKIIQKFTPGLSDDKGIPTGDDWKRIGTTTSGGSVYSRPAKDTYVGNEKHMSRTAGRHIKLSKSDSDSATIPVLMRNARVEDPDFHNIRFSPFLGWYVSENGSQRTVNVVDDQRRPYHLHKQNTLLLNPDSYRKRTAPIREGQRVKFSCGDFLTLWDGRRHDFDWDKATTHIGTVGKTEVVLDREVIAVVYLKNPGHHPDEHTWHIYIPVNYLTVVHARPQQQKRTKEKNA